MEQKFGPFSENAFDVYPYLPDEIRLCIEEGGDGCVGEGGL